MSILPNPDFGNLTERSLLICGTSQLKPQISIIVPSYNRCKEILQLLEALAKQIFLEFEVIVVIDGSNDGTWEALATSNWPFDLKIIWHPNSGRSASRNRGAAEARTDLLLFFDDDMEPQPDCVARHASFHTRYSNAVLVGQVPICGDKPETDVQRFRRYLEVGWTRSFPSTLAPFSPDLVYLTAAHFSISKNLFDSLGRFEKRDNWGEDRLLAIKLRELGHMIWYDPRAIAWHHDPMTFRRLVERLRQEWLTSSSPLYRVKRPFFLILKLKKVLLGLFTWRCWVEAIDRPAIWIVIWPRPVRWLIYRCVLAAWVYYYPQKALKKT